MTCMVTFGSGVRTTTMTVTMVLLLMVALGMTMVVLGCCGVARGTAFQGTVARLFAIGTILLPGSTTTVFD